MKHLKLFEDYNRIELFCIKIDSKEEFDKVIEKLKINAIYLEKCKYCNETIHRACTMGEKGIMCLNCEYKKHDQ